MAMHDGVRTGHVGLDLTIEIKQGTPPNVIRDIVEHLDGFQPSGGDNDYTVTDVSVQGMTSL